MHRREFFRAAGILTGAGLVTLVASEVGHDPWRRLAGIEIARWQAMKEKLSSPAELSKEEMVWTLGRKYLELATTLKSDAEGLAFQSISLDFQVSIDPNEYLRATYNFNNGQSSMSREAFVRGLHDLSRAQTTGGRIRVQYVGGSRLPNLDLTQDLPVKLPVGFTPSTILNVTGHASWSLNIQSGWSTENNLRLENNPYQINPAADFIAFDIRNSQTMQGQNYLVVAGQYNMSGQTGGLRVTASDEEILATWGERGLKRAIESYLALTNI